MRKIINYRAVVKLRGPDQGDGGFLPEQAILFKSTHLNPIRMALTTNSIPGFQVNWLVESKEWNIKRQNMNTLSAILSY